jgi:hypothetical protein
MSYLNSVTIKTRTKDRWKDADPDIPILGK